MKWLTPAVFLAAGLAAAPAFSQETPEAWISRLSAVSTKPVEVKQAMKLLIRGAEITGQGELLYLDDKHFATRMEMETFWPEQDKRARMIRRTVGDGQKQWNEMTSVETGQGAVQDLSFEQVKAQAKGDIYEGRINPAQQLLALLEYTDPQSVVLGEDTVELVADITEAGKSKLVPMLGGVVPKKLVVELDRKTGFPRSWKIQRYIGDTVLSFTYTDVRFPEAKKIDPERFVFRPSGEVSPAAGEAKQDQETRVRSDG
ncbi:MAG: hypothetical protein ISR76_08790 [Planctomycetes bacterium]|nr:hypothetical protein [Planctomycetota bacterium]MBL7009080.1 hypothetical protein [Planctomycetota bacterium]